MAKLNARNHGKHRPCLSFCFTATVLTQGSKHREVKIVDTNSLCLHRYPFLVHFIRMGFDHAMVIYYWILFLDMFSKTIHVTACIHYLFLIVSQCSISRPHIHSSSILPFSISLTMNEVTRSICEQRLHFTALPLLDRGKLALILSGFYSKKVGSNLQRELLPHFCTHGRWRHHLSPLALKAWAYESGVRPSLDSSFHHTTQQVTE